MLLLQVADEGRGEVLFGESLKRAGREATPFMVGRNFPSIYLECPLSGDPFLDITVLYTRLAPGTRVVHPAAAGSEGMLEWFAQASEDNTLINCGFELDIKEPELPQAAAHFQPREKTELVRPFCEAIGEPEWADLYLDTAKRMPDGWPLSFFGLFRRRPDSPLRVCGYLGASEQDACAANPQHLARAFDEVGFSDYDEAMLVEASTLLGAAPGSVDFQFDVFPDGHLGDTFAFDLQFEIEQPECVQERFSSGGAGRLMQMLEEKGVADSRWRLVPDAAFARAIPAQRDDGSLDRYAFTLMPQWVKARWRRGVLQPAKMYFLANAGFIEK